MTNLKKRRTMVNVGVDVGKWFLDICLYEKDLHKEKSKKWCSFRRIGDREIRPFAAIITVGALGDHFSLQEFQSQSGDTY